MRRTSITIGVLVLVSLLGLAAKASASGIVFWEGQGSDNLPCTSGQHWVLAPSFGIESAVLNVEYPDVTVAVPMEQNGQGSWAVDYDGTVPEGDFDLVRVGFEGPGDERNHLQLSHCLGGESPSPTSTPSPSPSQSGSPTPTPSETSSSSTPTPTKSTPTTTTTGTHSQSSSGTHGPRKLAMTGFDSKAAGVVAGTLLALGLAALWWARRLGGEV